MAACCFKVVQHLVRLHYPLLLRRGYALAPSPTASNRAACCLQVMQHRVRRRRRRHSKAACCFQVVQHLVRLLHYFLFRRGYASRNGGRFAIGAVLCAAASGCFRRFSGYLRQPPNQYAPNSRHDKREPVQSKREPVQHKREPVQSKREPVQHKREPVQSKREAVQVIRTSGQSIRTSGQSIRTSGQSIRTSGQVIRTSGQRKLAQVRRKRAQVHDRRAHGRNGERGFSVGVRTACGIGTREWFVPVQE
jgi:hypothetical protein